MAAAAVETRRWTEAREPGQSERRGRGTMVNVGGYVPDTGTAFNPVGGPSVPATPRAPLALPVRAR